MGRTAPLTSKRYILYIYSTNISTEYFKHALYTPFFSLQNAVGSYIIHILYTGCGKIKKNNSGAKRLIYCNLLKKLNFGLDEWRYGRGLRNTKVGESDVSQLQILSANCQSDCSKYKNNAFNCCTHVVRKICGGNTIHYTLLGKALCCCVSNIHALTRSLHFPC
jgi:hypothetical protein